MDPSHYADAQAFRANFKDIRTLGAGASGSVALVQHSFTLTKCALKRIKPTTTNSSDARRQSIDDVVSEVAALRQLVHPNIIRLFGSWHTPAGLNILMEYANGGSLQHEIVGRSKGPFWYDEDLILDYLVQMVSALAVVHAAGIVHRDLKPANVVFASGVLKVCDFGIAKVLGDSATCAQTCVGSPYYMSLEQMKGQKYKFDADAWALGIMLYELMALKKPFDAPNAHMLYQVVTRGVREPLDEDRYSSELRGIVDELLNKKPERRPSMAQLETKLLLARHNQQLQASRNAHLHACAAAGGTAAAPVAAAPVAAAPTARRRHRRHGGGGARRGGGRGAHASRADRRPRGAVAAGGHAGGSVQRDAGRAAREARAARRVGGGGGAARPAGGPR